MLRQHCTNNGIQGSESYNKTTESLLAASHRSLPRHIKYNNVGYSLNVVSQRYEVIYSEAQNEQRERPSSLLKLILFGGVNLKGKQRSLRCSTFRTGTGVVASGGGSGAASSATDLSPTFAEAK